MERLIQVLDDVDDLLAVLRQYCGWWPAARSKRHRLRVPATVPARSTAP